jgi:hypothetical protein
VQLCRSEPLAELLQAEVHVRHVPARLWNVGSMHRVHASHR